MANVPALSENVGLNTTRRTPQKPFHQNDFVEMTPLNLYFLEMKSCYSERRRRIVFKRAIEVNVGSPATNIPGFFSQSNMRHVPHSRDWHEANLMLVDEMHSVARKP